MLLKYLTQFTQYFYFDRIICVETLGPFTVLVDKTNLLGESKSIFIDEANDKAVLEATEQHAWF